MNIKSFQDTDTLYIEFRKDVVTETRDLDENTLLDLDSMGNVHPCGGFLVFDVATGLAS